MSFGNWYALLGLFIPALILAWVWLRDRFPKLDASSPLPFGRDGRISLPQDHGTARGGKVTDFFIKCCLSAAPLMMAVAIILLAEPNTWPFPKPNEN